MLPHDWRSLIWRMVTRALIGHTDKARAGEMYLRKLAGG